MNMNMYVYRVTEKQDSESGGKAGKRTTSGVQLERGEAHLNTAAEG